MNTSAQKKKIVIVDDQITNLTVGREALIGAYEVFTVPSGGKLLLLLKRVIPDLILLDIEMPEMNGYETLVQIKSAPETERIPVLFLTASANAKSEAEALALGAIGLIAKPFTASELLKHIGEIFDAQHNSRQP